MSRTVTGSRMLRKLGKRAAWLVLAPAEVLAIRASCETDDQAAARLGVRVEEVERIRGNPYDPSQTFKHRVGELLRGAAPE